MDKIGWGPEVKQNKFQPTIRDMRKKNTKIKSNKIKNDGLDVHCNWTNFPIDVYIKIEYWVDENLNIFFIKHGD